MTQWSSIIIFLLFSKMIIYLQYRTVKAIVIAVFALKEKNTSNRLD